MKKVFLLFCIYFSICKAYADTACANLPSGYTQVEYIESTGTQYIDTGYIPNNNSEIETVSHSLFSQKQPNNNYNEKGIKNCTFMHLGTDSPVWCVSMDGVWPTS